MDIRKIKSLIELFEKSTLAEIEVWEEESRIKMARYSQAPVVEPTPIAHHHAPLIEASSAQATPTDAAERKESLPANHVVVTSQLVGIFYATPSPEAAPFVRVGDSVKIGQTICMVEAMKMFNEVKAEVAGEVVKIHKKTGDPVEYGEPLLVLAT